METPCQESIVPGQRILLSNQREFILYSIKSRWSKKETRVLDLVAWKLGIIFMIFRRSVVNMKGYVDMFIFGGAK